MSSRVTNGGGGVGHTDAAAAILFPEHGAAVKNSPGFSKWRYFCSAFSQMEGRGEDLEKEEEEGSGVAWKRRETIKDKI